VSKYGEDSWGEHGETLFAKGGGAEAMSFNPANILTYSRLVLAPFFIWFFIAEYHSWAFFTFGVAAFTDLIDGTVARLSGTLSKRGAMFDPLADKILVQSCFVLLLINGLIPWWFFALAFARDLMIVSGIIYLEVKKAKLPYRAIWFSKFATIFQLSVAILGLLIWWSPWSSQAMLKVVQWQWISLVVAVVLIAVSGFQYVLMGLHILSERRAASNAS